MVTHYPGRHYEATLGSGFTKYFYADGQLISFERSPEYGDAYGRRYVFRDHLGSTSIIANGSGVRIWEDRYLPYGDIRYHSDTVTNTVQTRYRFTGQWLEDGLAASPENGLDRSLYLYGARWYDASLGRFIQPDTIVPEPGNPQALNRYAYVLNNPLRYTDPTGMFSEDEIMKYLGVETWEEVLKMFGKNTDSLNWGWLEVLRKAELGDEIAMWNGIVGMDWSNPLIKGTFSEDTNGQLIFSGSIAGGNWTVSAMILGRMNGPNMTYHLSNDGRVKGYLTNQDDPHLHYRWEDDIDWLGVGLDAAGIVADILTFGAGGRVINGIQVGKTAQQAGTALDIANILYTIGKTGVVAAGGDWHAAREALVDTTIAGSGVFIPILPDAISLYRGLVQVSP